MQSETGATPSHRDAVTDEDRFSSEPTTFGKEIVMKTLQINEGDQTIVAACDLDTYVPPNQFIYNIIEAAMVSGKATAKDGEGCVVTAIIN